MRPHTLKHFELITDFLIKNEFSSVENIAFLINRQPRATRYILKAMVTQDLIHMEKITFPVYPRKYCWIASLTRPRIDTSTAQQYLKSQAYKLAFILTN